MAERADSTRADARPNSPEKSTTRRVVLAGLAAAPAVALSPIAAAATTSHDVPEDDRRLIELLAQMRPLKARIKAAIKAYTRAEEATMRAAKGHPYPLVTPDDETTFNGSVYPGHDWTPRRLAYFDCHAWRGHTDRGFGGDVPGRAVKRVARMDELAPLVAAATESRRPYEEAESLAEEAYAAVRDDETEILSEAASISATTIAGLAAKASILAH